MALELNVKSLVNDIGGVRSLAQALNIHRTIPYRWIKTNNISSKTISKIVNAYPNLNLHTYFEEQDGTQ